MKARKLKYRIEVYKTVPVADGFGGNVIEDEAANEILLDSSWCNVKTIPISKLTEYGLDENQKAVRITLRKRDDLDYEQQGLFFKYKGVRYTVEQITEWDIDGYYFQIIASA